MEGEKYPQDQQRKRSKRHRMKRNNISDKARINSVIEFGIYSRQVERDYRTRYHSTQNQTTYLSK